MAHCKQLGCQEGARRQKQTGRLCHKHHQSGIAQSDYTVSPDDIMIIIDYILHIDQYFEPQRIKIFKNKFMSSCDGYSTDRLIAYLKEKFELVLPNQTGKFYDMIAKLTYKKSQLHNLREEDSFYHQKYSRISLDLYILDPASPSKLGFFFQCFTLKTLYGMMMRYRIFWNEYPFSQRCQILFLSWLGSFFPLPTLMRWYDTISRKNESHIKNCLFLFASNSILQKIHTRYRKESFSKTIPGKLGNSIFQIPIGYDDILRQRYRFYMIPTKEVFSISHAVSNEVKVWDQDERPD